MADIEEIKKMTLQLLGAATAAIEHGAVAKNLAVQMNTKLDELKRNIIKAEKVLKETKEENTRVCRQLNAAQKQITMLKTAIANKKYEN